MSIFRDAIEAVEENNRINDGKWSDWEDLAHIVDTYDLEYTADAIAMATQAFIAALIRDNGEHLSLYQQCIDCLEYGYPFARNVYHKEMEYAVNE